MLTRNNRNVKVDFKPGEKMRKTFLSDTGGLEIRKIQLLPTGVEPK